MALGASRAGVAKLPGVLQAPCVPIRSRLKGISPGDPGCRELRHSPTAPPAEAGSGPALHRTFLLSQAPEQPKAAARVVQRGHDREETIGVLTQGRGTAPFLHLQPS